MRRRIRTLIKWRNSLRDTRVLIEQFRLPIFLFLLTIIGGGLLYASIAEQSGEPLNSTTEAIYLALSLVFLQPNGEFPTNPLLQAFYFVMPVLGIGILAQGLADFGVMLFNHEARNKEWEMAIASTYKNHTILIGMGHLGFRMAEKMHELGEEVVVIDTNPKASLVSKAREMGIPIIQDDGVNEIALIGAGIEKARAVALCTQGDHINLQMAIKARSLNPDIQVIVRIFDEEFAQALQQQFGYIAMSATSMAAPAFAAAAAGIDLTRPLMLEGQALSLAKLHVAENSRLSKLSVADVERDYDVSVVLLRCNGETDMHPDGSRHLSAGDLVAVLGSPAQINLLVHDNH